jgi:hypothetical protein
MAVGLYENSDDVPQTLIESWNGSRWTIQSSPNASTNDVLTRVRCTSAASCEAVGYFLNSSNVDQTLVESWNGSSWTVQLSPNEGANSNDLESLSCVSATSCEAVGVYINSSNVPQTLVESWNGSSWTIQSSPNDGTGTNVLIGVSCISANSCEAVGYYLNSSAVEQTLVESYG